MLHPAELYLGLVLPVWAAAREWLADRIGESLVFFKEVPFESMAGALAIIAAIFAAPRLLARAKRLYDRRYIERRLNADAYLRVDIDDALANYVQPECQSTDPSSGEYWSRGRDLRRLPFDVREKAFKALDRIFHNAKIRHTLLLSDSAMGKSVLLLNYYSRWRWARYRFNGLQMALIPLGGLDPDERIAAVAEKSKTILMLDAFDEDIEASKDHKRRLKQLIKASSQFRHVFITCRTQFFTDDEEIPRGTELLRSGPTGPGEEHQYIFQTLYLSEFSDEQVERFIRKRWRIWQRHQRREARRMCSELGDLTVRPLILKYLPSLLDGDENTTYKFPFQVYERIVSEWCMRESAWVNPRHLRRFSEAAAKASYSLRAQRKSERLSAADAEKIAKEVDVPLRPHEIRNRSLLNRDSEGRLKFAHRTIMEYLYVCEFIENPEPQSEWTAQMERFFLDMAMHGPHEIRRKCGQAVIHLAVPLRRSLLEFINAQIHSGKDTAPPMSLEICTISLGNNSNRFLLVKDFRGGVLFAISERRLPSTFVDALPESFSVELSEAAIMQNGQYACSPAPRRARHLKDHYETAFSRNLRDHYDAAFSRPAEPAPKGEDPGHFLELTLRRSAISASA